MDELTTRRDSLTGLTPAELAASVRQLLATHPKPPYTTDDDRLTHGWEAVDGLCGESGEVDERKVQALLQLDLDIDLDL